MALTVVFKDGAREPDLRHVSSSCENVPGALLEIDDTHWQHPVAGRHARCQFMVGLRSRAHMVTIVEETRERTTRNINTKCNASLLKDWMVHRV